MKKQVNPSKSCPDTTVLHTHNSSMPSANEHIASSSHRHDAAEIQADRTFNFEVITPLRQEEERNSAYKFFRI